MSDVTIELSKRMQAVRVAGGARQWGATECRGYCKFNRIRYL